MKNIIGIIILLLPFLSFGQAFPDCLSCDENAATWNSLTDGGWGGNSTYDVSCYTRNGSSEATNAGGAFCINPDVRVTLNYIENDQWVRFPDGVNGLVEFEVKNTLDYIIDINRPGENNWLEAKLLRFYKDDADEIIKIEEIALSPSYNTNGDFYEGSYNFTKAGNYCLISVRNADRPCSDEGENMFVEGWMCVKPIIDDEVTAFSACFVGRAGECPENDCNCEDVLDNQGVNINQFYGEEQGDYQSHPNAKIWRTGDYASKPTFTWASENEEVLQLIDLTGQYSGTDAIHKGSFGENEDEDQIIYRLNPLTDAQGELLRDEEDNLLPIIIKVRATDGGIIGDYQEFRITPNLEPKPVYSYTMDCFGYKVTFENNTLIKDSEPQAIRYIWHFGDGKKISIPESGSEVKISEDENATFFVKAAGDITHLVDKLENVIHEYENPGTYKPILQIQYAFDKLNDDNGDQIWEIANDDLICGFRNVFIENEVITAAKAPFELSPIGTEEKSDQVKNYEYANILGASAITYKDAWQMDLGTTTVKNLNPFANSQQGVWRAEGTYSYMNKKVYTSYSESNIATDGTFNLNAFNWTAGSGGKKWVKAASMTQYSPYGDELENKDVLNRYSAALFGYGGRLATAVGANTQFREMAFSGFEEATQVDGTQSQLNSGNFNLLNKNSVSLKSIEVIGGNGEIAILNYPFKDVDDLMGENEKVLILSGQNIGNGNKGFVIENIKISCKYKDLKNLNQSLVYFSGEGLDILGEVWKGKLSYYQEVEGDNSGINTEMMISETEFHTGKKSLQILNNAIRTQQYLQLIPEKKYVISAWVKAKYDDNNGATILATYATESQSGFSNKIGIGILKDETGSTDNNYIAMFEPKGAIIDGWQRIEGIFTFPKDGEKLHLSLQKGNFLESFIDDIRVFPADGNMVTYVYDPVFFMLRATLDNNNYATLYSYDNEGNLYLLKKETERGIMTIQESMSKQKGTNSN